MSSTSSKTAASASRARRTSCGSAAGGSPSSSARRKAPARRTNPSSIPNLFRELPGRTVQFQTIYGVDFSGAKNAGRTIWIARARPGRGRRLVLEELVNLERASGHAAREPALAWLVEQIAASRDALWAIDFPFGLPTAVMDSGASWRDLLGAVANWPQDAYDFGLQCLARAKACGPAHVYRPTDRQ